MRYQPDNCHHCKTDTWCEYLRDKHGKINPVCRACKVVRFYEHVLYKPIGFKVLEAGEAFLRSIYAVDMATGGRRYRRGYCSWPKKNGKSFLVGGLPLYHLACEVDLEARQLRAYGAASAAHQAGEVFDSARELLDASPKLKNILRCVPSTHRILRRDRRGFYKVISADGGSHDGKDPSLVIIDELHRWTTPRCQTLYQVLVKGVIARQQPFIAEITTAGEEFACPLWEREHALAEQVIAGAPSKSLFAQIWSADKQKYQKDGEYWKSKEARVAANPSHEDNGGFLKDEAIVVELEKAIADPAEKPDYVRYHLNLMVNRGEEAAIDMDRWKANQDLDLRDWPTYDAELLVLKWGLRNKKCYCGVDLSATTDLTAISFVFPPDAEDGLWTVLPFVWVPEHQTARSKAVDYTRWIAQKWIETCAGWEIRNSDIKARIDWGRKLFDLREVCLDPWNARDLRQDLEDDGYTAVIIDQGYKLLSEPTKKILALYLGGKLRHGNNPVFNWAASCAATVADKKDNVMFSKPDRGKTGKRIDPLAGTATGMSRAILSADQTSVYANPEAVV